MRRISVCFLKLLLLMTASNAWAQEEVMRSRNVHYNKVWHSADVGDVEGHVIGLYENNGVSFHEDGEMAILAIRGTLDLTGQTGSEEGYEIRTYDDGSTIILKYDGQPTDVKDQSEGTLTCIGGTGRFEGIKCDGVYSGGTKGELQVYDTEVKYNLSK
jgi:hypothetical protein